MSDDATEPLADLIDCLLEKEGLTVPGIAGQLTREGVATDDVQELIALINQRKYQR